MSRAKLFLTNAASVLGSRLTGNIVSLITLPVFVSYFGNSLYGLFILAMTASTTLSQFDFGVNSALIRYSAEYKVDEDNRRFEAVLAGSLLIAAVLGFLSGLAVYLLSFHADSFFGVATADALEAKTVFRLAAVFTLLIILLRTSQGLLEGYQLFYWVSLNQMVTPITTLVVLVLVQTKGMDFVTFAGAMMLGTLLPSILNVVVIVKKGLLNKISLRHGVDWSIIRNEFLVYSGNLFLLQLIAFGSMQADKFIVGGLLSASLVTAYTIVTKPTFIIRMISNQTLKILGPVLAELGRQDRQNQLNSIIKRGNLALGILVFPMVGLVFLFVRPFITLWVGEEFAIYSVWGAIAALIFLFTPLYSIAVRLYIFSGNAEVVRNISLITVLVNLCIGISTTRWLGLGGVVLGSLAQASIQVPIYYWLLRRDRRLSVGDMLPKSFWLNLLFVSLVTAAFHFLLQHITVDTWWDLLALLGICAMVMYSLGAWLIIRFRLFGSGTHKLGLL